MFVGFMSKLSNATMPMEFAKCSRTDRKFYLKLLRRFCRRGYPRSAKTIQSGGLYVRKPVNTMMMTATLIHSGHHSLMKWF